MTSNEREKEVLQPLFIVLLNNEREINDLQPETYFLGSL